MSTTIPVGGASPLENRYLELLIQFPPKPIASEADFLATQAVIDRLLDARSLTPQERDYLNLLGMLVHEYEEKHVSIPDLQGVELLKALLEELDLKQKDLVPIFKTESIVSAILNGQRQFTVEHIEKLAAFFHVSPAVFFTNRLN
jgi:HTH-type transcriptional regulator / antitoxin HigA